MRFADRQESKSSYRIGLLVFVAGWVGIWQADHLISNVVIHELRDNLGILRWLALSAFLPALQYLWIRRALKISLRWWVPLTMLGAYVGGSAYFLYIEPFNWRFGTASAYGSGIFPLMRIAPQYAVEQLLSTFLFSSVPLIFGWLVLCRRFGLHALWLLAAIVVTPLQFAFLGNYSPFKTALRLLDQITGHMILRDFELIEAIALTVSRIDEAIPVAITGLVMYVVVTQSRKADARTVKRD